MSDIKIANDSKCKKVYIIMVNHLKCRKVVALSTILVI